MRTSHREDAKGGTEEHPRTLRAFAVSLFAARVPTPPSSFVPSSFLSFPVRPDGDDLDRPAGKFAEPVRYWRAPAGNWRIIVRVADLLLPSGTIRRQGCTPAKILGVRRKTVDGCNRQCRRPRRFSVPAGAKHVQEHHASTSTPPNGPNNCAATASNQPQRRGRRVTVPYSLPRSRICCPISLSCSVGRSAAHPCGIGLQDPDDLGDDIAPARRTRGNPYSGAVTARDKREGPMVDIEQEPWAPSKRMRLPDFHCVQEVGRGVHYVRFESPGIAAYCWKISSASKPNVLRLGIPRPGEHTRLSTRDLLDPLAETIVVHVAEANGQGASDLVTITGADAPHGGADRFAGRGLVEQAIFLEVPREDDVGAVADKEIVADLDSPCGVPLDFVQEAAGFKTTPPVITHCTRGRKMPLGTRESLNFWLP